MIFASDFLYRLCDTCHADGNISMRPRRMRNSILSGASSISLAMVSVRLNVIDDGTLRY